MTQSERIVRYLLDYGYGYTVAFARYWMGGGEPLWQNRG